MQSCAASSTPVVRMNFGQHLFMRTWLICLVLSIGMRLAEAACPGVVTVPRTATIAFEGDSTTYGSDATGTGGQPPINSSKSVRSKEPFPELVGQSTSLNIINRGYPGDRSVEGMKRWANAPEATASFVMYGTNDQADYGASPNGTVSLQRFRANLITIVQRRLSAGTEVVLLTPPPIQGARKDWELDIYRSVVRDVAVNLKVPVIDTPRILSVLKNKWVDGVHLSIDANVLIADAIARQICVK